MDIRDGDICHRPVRGQVMISVLPPWRTLQKNNNKHIFKEMFPIGHFHWLSWGFFIITILQRYRIPKSKAECLYENLRDTV